MLSAIVTVLIGIENLWKLVKIDNNFGLKCSDLFPLRSFSSFVDDYDNIIVSFKFNLV